MGFRTKRPVSTVAIFIFKFGIADKSKQNVPSTVAVGIVSVASVPPPANGDVIGVTPPAL